MNMVNRAITTAQRVAHQRSPNHTYHRGHIANSAKCKVYVSRSRIPKAPIYPYIDPRWREMSMTPLHIQTRVPTLYLYLRTRLCAKILKSEQRFFISRINVWILWNLRGIWITHTTLALHMYTSVFNVFSIWSQSERVEPASQYTWICFAVCLNLIRDHARAVDDAANWTANPEWATTSHRNIYPHTHTHMWCWWWLWWWGKRDDRGQRAKQVPKDRFFLCLLRTSNSKR